MNSVTECYANAFIDIAKDQGKLLDYKSIAKDLVPYFNKDVLRFLGLSVISKEEKKEALKEWFGSIDKNFLNLFYILVDNSRTKYIKEILVAFIHKCNEELNIKEVKVQSAKKLSNEELKTIKEAIEKKLNKEVEITESVDETLISGICVNIDGRVIDATMRRKINNLRDNLLEESW